jgi:hypothetical protein
MKRLVSSFAVAVALVATAQGCSSSDVSVAAITAKEGCDQLAATYCGKIQSCTSFYLMLGFEDEATCKTRFSDQCVRNLAATGQGSTPAKMASCASKAASVSCADLFASNLPAECHPVAGTLANGVACGDASQCQSAFCGGGGGTSTCGTCAAAPVAEAACAGGACPNGLECGKTDGKCHKIGNVNDVCDGDHECNATLVCFNGKCAAPTALGADCDPANVSSPTRPPCDLIGGAFCNLKSKKCEPIAQNAAVGADCGLDLTSGGLTVCEKTAYCNITNATTYSGKCVARVADGGACDATANTLGSPCVSPANCIGNVCKITDASLCK